MLMPLVRWPHRDKTINISGFIHCLIHFGSKNEKKPWRYMFKTEAFRHPDRRLRPFNHYIPSLAFVWASSVSVSSLLIYLSSNGTKYPTECMYVLFPCLLYDIHSMFTAFKNILRVSFFLLVYSTFVIDLSLSFYSFCSDVLMFIFLASVFSMFLCFLMFCESHCIALFFFFFARNVLCK